MGHFKTIAVQWGKPYESGWNMLEHPRNQTCLKPSQPFLITGISPFYGGENQ